MKIIYIIVMAGAILAAGLAIIDGDITEAIWCSVAFIGYIQLLFPFKEGVHE